MSAPPWGHKPPKVAEVYDYFGSPPPHPSERAVYWVRRWREGSWKPNRHGCCLYCRAGSLGVWVWESSKVISDLWCLDEALGRGFDVLRGASGEGPAEYWDALEFRSRPRREEQR